MAGLQYGLFRSGPMTGNGVTAGVFTRSDPRLERPDIQINLMEWSTKERSRDAVIPHDFPGFTLTPVHLRTEGRGSVRLTSPDPFAWPAVLFDYLRTDNDIRAALFGLRLVRTIAAQPALKPYVVDEIFPGLDIQSDAALLDYTRRTGVSNQHPTSSCAMGTGPNAVVDPRLRVFGIAGLRVADASIMPVVVGGNTNAPTIMIGEKAAAMILQDAAA
jgi:choline dehydrogenase